MDPSGCCELSFYFSELSRKCLIFLLFSFHFRDYLGEKISFYFAFVGTLIASLVIPAVIGLCVFFYGVVQK